MSNQASLQHNKLMELDQHNEALKKLINTVHEIHNVTSSHEKLFAGEHNATLFRMLCHGCLRNTAILQLIHCYFLELYRINTFPCMGN